MRPNLHLAHIYRGHAGPVYSLQGWREGHFLSCGSDGFVAEWALGQEEGRTLVQCPGAVYSMLALQGGRLLAAGTQQGLLCLADLQEGKVLHTWQAHDKGIFDFLQLPDGSLLTTGGDGHLSRWDLDNMQLTHRQQVSAASVRTAILLPGGQLALGSSDGHIRILSREGKWVHDWQAHRLSVFRLLWDDARGLLWSVGRDAQLHAWQLAHAPSQVETASAHLYAINDVVLSPAGGHLVTASMDKTLKLWSPQPLELQRVADRARNGVHNYGVNRLLVCDGHLLSCSDDKTIQQWSWTEED